MLYLLLILLVLTIIYFYVFFIREVDSDIEYFSSSRGKAAFFAFLALTILTAYTSYREFTAESEIAKYIVPYSGNMEAVYTPAIPGNKGQIWMFKSKDQPEQIQSFYADNKNREGWELIRDFPFMILRQNKKEIVISVSRPKETLITYELREAGR